MSWQRVRIPLPERLALMVIAERLGKDEEEILREAIRALAMREVVREPIRAGEREQKEEVDHADQN